MGGAFRWTRKYWTGKNATYVLKQGWLNSSPRTGSGLAEFFPPMTGTHSSRAQQDFMSPDQDDANDMLLWKLVMSLWKSGWHAHL